MNLAQRLHETSAVERASAEVLAASQQMSRGGLVASVWGNVSARIAGTDLAVVTPSGVDYETMDAGMLDVMERLDGRARRGRARAQLRGADAPRHLPRPRGRARGDAHAQHLGQRLRGRAEGHPGRRRRPGPGGRRGRSLRAIPLAGTEELAASVVEALGSGSAALLANHGVVGVGRTLAEALRVCQIVEKGAQIYALASSIGRRWRCRRAMSRPCATPTSTPTARRACARERRPRPEPRTRSATAGRRRGRSSGGRSSPDRGRACARRRPSGRRPVGTPRRSDTTG